MVAQQIKGNGVDEKSNVKDKRLYAWGSSRISRPGCLNVHLESSVCLSCSTELQNLSEMRPFSLKPWLSMQTVPVACGMMWHKTKCLVPNTNFHLRIWFSF